MNINITNMHLKDIEDVFNIQLLSYPKSLCEDQGIFIDILQAPESICIIAKYKSDIIGYILGYATSDHRNNFLNGYIKSKNKSNCIYLHDLCVIQAKRGKKIGYLLFSAFFSEVNKLDYNKIIALSLPSALKFWKNLGFIQKDYDRYNNNLLYKITMLL